VVKLYCIWSGGLETVLKDLRSRAGRTQADGAEENGTRIRRPGILERVRITSLGVEASIVPIRQDERQGKPCHHLVLFPASLFTPQAAL